MFNQTDCKLRRGERSAANFLSSAFLSFVRLQIICCIKRIMDCKRRDPFILSANLILKNVLHDSCHSRERNLFFIRLLLSDPFFLSIELINFIDFYYFGFTFLYPILTTQKTNKIKRRNKTETNKVNKLKV